MHIQRYETRNRSKGAYFGECSIEKTWDFDWHLGDEKIGIIGNPSAEAEYFIGGFLIRDDELIVNPEKDWPLIYRLSEKTGRMAGRHSGISNINRLVELFQSHEIIHSYKSSLHEDGHNPNVLTFSSQEPSKELYNKGKVMPIRFTVPFLV